MGYTIRRKGAPLLSEGHRLVIQLIARVGEVEVSRYTHTGVKGVGHWKTGARKPGAAARVALSEKWAIPTDSWEVPPSTPEAPARPRPPAAPGGALADLRAGDDPLTTRDRLLRQIARLERNIEAAESNGNFGVLAPLETALKSVVRELARDKGELEVGESVLVRSIYWRRLLSALEDALKPCPHCPARVVKALEGFGA